MCQRGGSPCPASQPQLTPDQVKSVLLTTARPISGATAVQAGAGELDAAAAVTAATRIKAGSAPVVQTWPVATGSGSLDAARGDSHLVDPDTGAILAGEVDILGSPWNPARWSAASTAGQTWTGGQWNGARWTGDAWTTGGWARARWADGAWARARWADGSWDTARWSRARWADAMWDRARWASSALS